ncbi:RING finger protein nhl-1-like [Pocillopora verrucosa]|uniref:RING finger protein nhl-1-like n=1 Tax=Pocillopora verrucosa TaxID=203993 RepID=UPI00333F8572
MSAIITEVFKATVGWLVDKSRDELAKELKDGDVTDQRFRSIIMREIDEMKSKRDGLSRRDLLASITFFREGIELLYGVFEEKRSRSKYGADKGKAACADVLSFTEGMKHLKLTKSATRQLTYAKKRFKSAREMATIAFSNEALSTTDRILAMQYRVMATVLEKIDHPADAVTPCNACIEELNGLPVVQRGFQEQLRTGIMAVKSLFNKEERRKVISGVCLVNRVAYDVIQTVHVEKPFTTEPFAKELLPPLSMIDTGKEKVDLLRDRRVRKILCKQGMENCSVSWILGHDGEKKHRLNNPLGIAINSSGQYIVADNFSTIKVYDSSGKFLQCFSLPPLIDDSPKELSIQFGVRLTTDMKDNIYVLVQEISGEYPFWISKFNKTADHHHKFRVRTMDHKFERCELSVSDSGTVMVLRGNWSEAHIVDVYETDGQFVCSFGEQILTSNCDITSVSDGRVMVVQGPSSCVHIFSEQGDHLNTFDLQISMAFSNIAFHRASQHVVVVGDKDYNSDILHIEIYTKDGEFVRSTAVNMGQSYFLKGMAVTTKDRIALVTWLDGLGHKVIII